MPNFYVATGIYQLNPNEDNANAGFDLSFRSTGVLLPVELGWLRVEAAVSCPAIEDRRLLQHAATPTCSRTSMDFPPD